MSTPPHLSRLQRRDANLLLALGAVAAGCNGASWQERRELAPFKLPARVPIMVWKSPLVRQIDREGIADAVATTLERELAARGVQSEVVELAGEPRLPRIELAFWTLDADLVRPTVDEMYKGQRAISVDCAFVTAADVVAFVGRVRGFGKNGQDGVAVEMAATAIAEAMTGG